MSRTLGTIVVVTLLLAAPALPARARSAFVPLPGSGSQTTSLQIRVVRYTGGVHGKMIVEIRNPGAGVESFSASGLYFVPAMAPERAPQREGAAGPFEVASLSSPAVSTMPVQPGRTLRLHLSTFCLDSHRASPSHRQVFRVASRRLPPRLTSAIEGGALQALRGSGGDLDAAAPAIQSLVWQTRQRSWVVLEGERPGERSTVGPASAPSPSEESGLINL